MRITAISRLMPPFGGGVGLVPPPPTGLAGTLLEAIVARFDSSVALLAHFPHGVYADKTGNTPPPFIPYAIVSVPDDHVTDYFSDATASSITIRFRLYGPTPDSLVVPAALLKGPSLFRGRYLEWSEGYTNPLNRGRDVVAIQSVPGPDGQPCWLQTIEFRGLAVRQK